MKILLFRLFSFLGFNPILLFQNIINLPWYVRDFIRIKKQLKNNNTFKITSFYPVLNDKNENSGSIRSHYFWQDFYVARLIYENKPFIHVDIGSRIDGFITHVASFRTVEVFDIRPLNDAIYNVNFTKVDFSGDISFYHEYADSISSLHVIEHFGLGRYNDPIDVNGHISGINNCTKILKKGGIFYFSTPIGPQRIEFNAHRVFSVSYLLELFQSNFNLLTFSFVDDNGNFNENVELTPDMINCNLNCNYGCGIFVLEKK